MVAKTRVTLTPEQETLLIPLYARAQPENSLFFDPCARVIFNQVDYDFARLRVPYKTIVLKWYFAQDPDLDRLSLGYRLAYRLAGAFDIVRRVATPLA